MEGLTGNLQFDLYLFGLAILIAGNDFTKETSAILKTSIFNLFLQICRNN
jgi:hypothetical protein